MAVAVSMCLVAPRRLLEVGGLDLDPEEVLVVCMLQILAFKMRFLVKQAMLDLLDQRAIQDVLGKPVNQARV